MHDTFYIIKTKGNGVNEPDWYQLRLTKTHFCVSCGGDLQKRLDIITKWVAKYRTPECIYRMLEKCDSHGHISPATFEKNRAEYSEYGHVFDEEIYEAVEKGLKVKRENTPLKKTMKRIKVVEKTPQTLPTPVIKEKAEEKEVVPVMKKGLINSKLRKPFRQSLV